MTYTMEAIRHFGHEDPITIAIATLEAQGKEGLAAALLERVLTEIYDDDYLTDEEEGEEEDSDDEWDFVMIIS